ncbi:MAG: ABC transporter ATP-binding protein [Thermoplasmata archaeon]|nr:ABC transporter ATP-binding protein [Thermoplasmata archaeon]
MLKVRNAWIEADGKKILKGVNLEVGKGEVHVIFGPNGSGKSTLLAAIMGLPSYKITDGEIIFKGRDIKNEPIWKRAKMGIGIAFQSPPEINLKMNKLLENLDGNIEKYAKELRMEEYIDRDINKGFSGGERKRSEILQIAIQQPDLLLLDEPESGVDMENIYIISKVINELLEKNKRIVERKRSAVIITHTGYILDFIDANLAHVMMDGKIICKGPPRDVLETIKKYGYEKCSACAEGD